MQVIKELNNIIDLKGKKMTNDFLNKLNFNEREILQNLNKNLYYLDEELLNFIKNNTSFIEIFNNSKIKISQFNFFYQYFQNYNLNEIIKEFDEKTYIGIENKIEELENNFKNSNISFYISYKNKKILTTFCYINLINKNIKDEDLHQIISNYQEIIISFNKSCDKKTKDFSKLLIEILKNIQNLLLPIICNFKDNLYNLLKLIYKDEEIDLNMLNYLNNLYIAYNNKNNINIFKRYKPCKTIINTLNMIEDIETKEEIKNIILKFGENQISVEWVEFLIKNSNECLDIKEIKRLSYINIDKETEVNPIKVLYNKPVLNRLYEVLENSYRKEEFFKKINFVKDNIKKKAFLKLLNENIDSYIYYNENSILFNDIFSKIVNINTLNINNLDQLNHMIKSDISSYFREDIPLTFNEFEVLYNLIEKNCLNLEIYYNLLDLKIDHRLKLIKQLPVITSSKLSIKSDQNNIDFSNDFLIYNLSKILKEKSFRDRINSLEIKIKKVTDYQYLLLFLHENMFENYINQIKYGIDIEFLILNYKNIEESKSILKTKEKFYLNNRYYNFLIQNLNASEEFIENNKKGIIEFCDKGLHEVFYGIFKNKRFSDAQIENLKLLVKAEISNKLKDIKFKDNDFELEIGLNISQEIKDEWKKNIVSYNRFKFEETYDFETIIKIGEYPTHTCQHWKNGSYSHCLLANFDTNKKILISSENEVINARSLIRVTKGSFSNKHLETKLTFDDIEKENQTNQNIKNDDEQLILFLEKLYTNLYHKEEMLVRKEFLKLAKEKAKKLGALLVVSDDYYELLKNDDRFKNIDYNIFISYSKNGCQYLDSLNGETNAQNEGKYNYTSVYIEK